MGNIVIVAYRGIMSRYVPGKTEKSTSNLSKIKGIPDRFWKAKRQNHEAGVLTSRSVSSGSKKGVSCRWF